MKTPRDIADAISQAMDKQDASTGTVLIGTAAFIAAVIFKAYPPQVRKQQVVNFANAVLDMVEKVEAEMAPKQEPRHEDTQEAWMKWSQ